MKKNSATLILWSLAVVCVFTCAVHASMTFPSAFHYEFSPSTELKMEVPVTMSLMLRPKQYCGDTITLELTTERNLTAKAPATWSATFGPDTTYRTQFEVIIPKGDTSSLILTAKCGYKRIKFWRYFVTTGDTVEYWVGNPRFHVKYPLPKHDDPDNPYILDSTWTRKDGDGPLIEDGGSGGMFDSTTRDRREHPHGRSRPWGKMTMEELREREKTPCTGVSGERVLVGYDTYTRDEGEHKYRKSEPILDRKARMKELAESRRDGSSEKVYHIVMDLRDPAHREFVQALLADSLSPMERAGYFHGTFPKQQVGEIEHIGIKCARYPNYPGDPKSN